MDGKIILEGFILILVVSLAFATIYAAETGEITHGDSPNYESHIVIRGSGDANHVYDFDSPVHMNNDLPTVYV